MDVNRNNNGTRGLPSADRTEADFAAYSEMPELLSCSNVSGITPSVVRRTAKGTEKETKTDVVFKLQCKQRMKTLGWQPGSHVGFPPTNNAFKKIFNFVHYLLLPSLFRRFCNGCKVNANVLSLEAAVHVPWFAFWQKKHDGSRLK
ncbi:hypothetical protein F2P81_025857 [Scophthalmus maximus]|uniref:Uncharacterized protein n=1 Tax=Scophthalmus maximus TaxID=52904 RepID=A0A6A4RR89_SCOMX|nr:hypothetical protein F2P81_025857 [Scophthalmus maximus]